MKKLILLAMLIVGLPAFAQEKPLISSAVIAIDRNNDTKAAKEYIDEAEIVINSKSLTEVREKDLAKFYFYKGLINYRVHQSEDPAIKGLDAEALDKALDGFTSLLEFEKKIGKERYTDEAVAQITSLANAIASRGIEASGSGDVASAYEDFLQTYHLKRDILGSTDTSMYYNAAIMAQQMKAYDKALVIYKDLLKLDYHGTRFRAIKAESGDTVEFLSPKQMEIAVKTGQVVSPMSGGDIRPDLYRSVIYLALDQGDTALYKETLAEGRQKFPDNIDLIKAELQLFFDNGEYDKALANLDRAIEADPKNPMMYYNKGVILQNEMKRPAQALKAYEQTLAVDPEYTDALYMTSIIYLDSANVIFNQMNDLPPTSSAQKKYDALNEQRNGVFEVALPYLEKAYELSPEDPQVKNALGQVYRALRMYEKAKALLEE